MVSASMDGITVTGSSALVFGVEKASLYSILTVLVLSLTVTIFVLIFLYIKMALKSLKEKDSLTLNENHWYGEIISYIEGDQQDIPIDDSEEFKTYLIQTVEEGVFQLEDIKKIYVDHGFLYDDTSLIENGEWWEKTEAMKRMKILKIKEEEELVSKFLYHDKTEVRLSALDMLADIKSGTLYHRITDIFEVNSDDLNEYIILELFKADIPPFYFQPLFVSDKDKLRLAAAVMIGREDNVDALPHLNSLSKDFNEQIRLEAVRSLGRTRLEDAISILKNKTDDDSKTVRSEVAKALGRIGSSKARPILEDLLHDPEYEVRLQSYLALRRFGSEGLRITRSYEDKDPIAAQEAVMRSVFEKGARINA